MDSKNNSNVAGILNMYKCDHCWRKGSLQTLLSNIFYPSGPNCRFSFAIWKISALKSVPGFSSGRTDSSGREKGKNGNLWFCGIFSNTGSRVRPILWLHLCPRECFPCQHTSLPVAEHGVSCGFRSWHPGSVLVLLLPVLGRRPTVVR